MTDLRSRPVLITGCSSGIGRAAALAFREHGFTTVVATARDGVRRLADLAAAGCETLDLDVADEASMAAAVAAVEARHGAVGILVNNAGFAVYGPLETLAMVDVRREFEVNVFGLMRMAQLVLPGMRGAGRGRIINVSSVAGRLAMPGGAAYHASKFAVEALAESLRPEVSGFGVAVVNILPGPVATGFEAAAMKSLPPPDPASPYHGFVETLRRFISTKFQPGGLGVLSPEDVAGAILTAATARSPRPRYSVGLLAKLGPLARIIPARLRDAVIARVVSR
jgi:NAD(P)-dependent dehydrogenase (short-subunit alcohol dehydrogenase family)